MKDDMTVEQHILAVQDELNRLTESLIVMECAIKDKDLIIDRLREENRSASLAQGQSTSMEPLNEYIEMLKASPVIAASLALALNQIAQLQADNRQLIEQINQMGKKPEGD